MLVKYSRLLLVPRAQQALFSLPCVMDAQSFTRCVNEGGKRLQDIRRAEMLAENRHLFSQAFAEEVSRKAMLDCAGLVNLAQREVEDIMREKYHFEDHRLVTCLVPYQLGVNMILARLPPSVREESILELKREEEQIQRGESPRVPHKWIQWHDTDAYVSTGKAYLRRIGDRRSKKRIPIFSVLGHVNHGKTTLIDALQGSWVSQEESHGITQTIRAFTVEHPTRENEFFTFLDSPGHRMFVETRYHSQLVSDYVILVLSVVEGIQSQTYEVIKVALNMDRPLLVVFNKLDLFTDAFAAQVAMRRLLEQLEEIGLTVHLVKDEAAVQDISGRGGKGSGGTPSSPPQSAMLPSQENFFLPVKQTDPSFKGSTRAPVIDVRRKCVGVCVSAKNGTNLPLLWSVLSTCRDQSPPTCLSNTAGPREHNCAVQAVVIESSKHLFDEEGFRQSIRKQQIQGRLDAKRDRKQRAFERNSVRSRVNSSMHSSWRQSTRPNRTSSNTLSITVIVKEGVLTPDTHFVADQAEGCVDYLLDYWGHPLEKALPGMAVTLIDTHSCSGCPGAGTHVLSTVDQQSRLRIHRHRQVLQWYVEIFTTKLDYLKPRGMDTSFAHLGDYGQLGLTGTLEYQLLYGAPPPPPEGEADGKRLGESSSGGTSLGEYLAERNEKEEQRLEGGCVAYLPGSGLVASSKRVSQAVVSPSDAELLESTWRGMQMQTRITSLEAYDKHVQQCTQIGVLIKVDSWHTSRMLLREISRLGTRKVFFQVVGARFGSLTLDDILFFSSAIKVIICFRTPQAGSADLDQYIEAADMWVLHTDHFADIELFLKWCAVETHKKRVAEDKGEEEGSDESAQSSRRYMVVDSKPPSETASTVTDGAATPAAARKQKLLAYKPLADE